MAKVIDPAPHDLPIFMTTAELAGLTRNPESTVRGWRRTGFGPRAIRIGRRALYNRADVATWLADLDQRKVA